MPKSVPPVVPCTLDDNKFNDNGQLYSIIVNTGTNYGVNGNYGINVASYSSNTPEINFSFKQKPTNGIYKVSSYSEFNQNTTNKLVYVTYTKGIMVTFDVVNDANVYIEVKNNTITLTACQIFYTMEGFSGKVSFNGKLITTMK